MAIKNASDLLVYAKTTDPAEQVTRIYVKTVNPFIFPDVIETRRKDWSEDKFIEHSRCR